MNEFIMASFPWVLMGLAIATFASSCVFEVEEGMKKQKSRMAMGMSVGILSGIAITAMGLISNYALGISIGLLWGIVLSMDDKRM